MDSRKQLGKMGEKKAADYLERKGYTIIEQNFKCRIGELDIIAMDGNTLVAVEVKTRSNLSYGLPCESITAEKQRHVLRTFKFYSAINRIKGIDMRIDVIEILSTGEGIYFNHIKNAI
ncbi:YraN family protein [Bacillota bacterium]